MKKIDMKLIIKSTKKLSDNEKLELTFQQYINWYMKDIKQIAKNLDAPISAFILCFTMIDALSGLFQPDKDNGPRFKEFVKTYLKKYNSNDMWKILRNGLVHSYSIVKKDGKISYFFRQDNKGNLDDVPVIKNDREQYRATTLELHTFISDLEKALNNFKQDAKKDPLKSNLIKRINKIGIIASV